MPMIAILSDIHGNLEALTAVLRDASSMNADEIICLGDVVGYGSNPCECLELAMSWSVVTQGNFEHALFESSVEWPPQLVSMMNRLREKFRMHPNGNRMLSFARNCPTIFERDRMCFVHGSAREHLDEYVFPEHVHIPDTMQSIFDAFHHVCFCGHTHLPGVFFHDGREWVFQTPDQFGDVLTINSSKLLCNVGSVGQPRDEDRRACDALLDDGHIVFRRIDYDYETTMAKIRDSDDDDMNGTRLPLGR